MRKKYKIRYYDGDYFSWKVVLHDKIKDMDYTVAEFFGPFSQQYARDHAKRLNALPKGKKP